MIIFSATARRAVCLSDDPITSGSVGIEMRLSLSSEWEGLAKVAVFRAGSAAVDIAVSSDTVLVPPDVLTTPGEVLKCGLYGVSETGTIVIPTVYADAGRILRGAEPSGIEPTPQTASLVEQLLAAAQSARGAAEAAEALAQSVRDDADAGEFDGTPGADGSNIWEVDAQYTQPYGGKTRAQIPHFAGRATAPVAAGDLVVISDGRLCVVDFTLAQTSATMSVLADLTGPPGEPGEPGEPGSPGEPGVDGVSPEVTITEITGGHRVTITDADHPSGQSFDVMDGEGGGGTSDYSALSNKPSIEGVTLSGNKTAEQLGLAKASDIPTVPSASSSAPAALGTAAAGSSTDYSRADHVHERPAEIDRNAAELLALSQTKPSTDYTWTVGKAWSSSGTNTNNNASARTAKMDAVAGAVVQSKCSATVNSKTVYIHVVEWAGDTFVKRTYLRSGGYVTLGSTTTKFALNFAYDSGQSAPNMDAATIASDFGVRVVEPFPVASDSTPQALGTATAGSAASFSRSDHVHAKPTASDIGAVAVDQGVAHAGEFVVVGSDGNITTVTMSVWQGGSY